MTGSEADDEKQTVAPVSGVIYPPPDTRAIVDKTAAFVARNGQAFESKILAANEGNAKFSFLRDTSPYHAYYQSQVDKEALKIVAEKEAPAKAASAGSDATGSGKPTTPVIEEEVKAKPVQSATARAVKGKVDAPPPPLEFELFHPATLSLVDSEVIKLTAQYTAVSGRSFLSEVAMRERNNHKFDFLKPANPLFGYFTKLVDSYQKILDPSANESLKKSLQRTAGDRLTVLDRCVHRVEWDRREREKREAAEHEENTERLAFLQIDWHDFVVVETIVFDDAEESSATANAATPNNAVEPSRINDTGAADMEIDPAESSNADSSAYADDDVELNVRDEVVPRAGGTSRSADSATQMVTYNGRQIPVDEMNEHMRIDLMDARYSDQRARHLQKQKESNLTGENIAKNLSKLAAARTDIFGGNEVERQKKEKERAAAANRVIWDGHTGSISETQRAKFESAAYEKQLAKMQERAGNVASGGIGPSAPATQPITPAFSASVQQQQQRQPQQQQQQQQQQRWQPQRQQQMQLQHHSGPPSVSSGATQQGMMPPPALPRPPQPPPPPQPALPAPQQSSTAALHAAPSMPMAPPAPLAPPTPGAEMLRTSATSAANMEPPTKRAKVSEARLAEAEFASSNVGCLRLSAVVPVDAGNATWNLSGQTVEVEAESVQITVGDLKKLLSSKLGGVPSSKFQVKSNGSFLKDAFSLAHYNIASGTTLEIKMKSRGGRR